MLDSVEGRRRTRLLAEKVSSDLDAVVCTSPENVYFFTGFRTMLYTRFVAALIRMDSPEEPILIVSTVDRRLIEDRVWSPPWVTRVSFHGPEQSATVASSPALALQPHLHGAARIGVDSIRLSDLGELERAAPGARIEQIAGVIGDLKGIKKEREIEYIRQANGLAMKGLELAADILQGGPTTELEIAVRLEAEARRDGADGFGYPTLVSAGAKMVAVHSPALRRKVELGQPVRVAFGPTVEGYTGDVVRTYCVGQPPAELLRLEGAFLAARDALLGLIRPGVTVPNMLAAVRAIYEDRGVAGYWWNNIGHGLGLTVHEPPAIGGTSEAVLLPGMVVALEPNLLVPGIGGFAHCDVVVVTETGYDLLTDGMNGLVRVG